MFELDFGATLPRFRVDAAPSKLPTSISPVNAAYLGFLRWEEHCLECSPPACFRTCSLYSRRRDRMCARFENGIVANVGYEGPLDYGAEIEFRRWGKLEAKFTGFAVTQARLKKICRLDARLLNWLRPVADIYNPLVPIRKLNLNIAYNRLRRSWLGRTVASSPPTVDYDEFVIELVNRDTSDVTFLLEVLDSTRVYSRHALAMKSGRNLYRLPWRNLNVPDPSDSDRSLRFKFYPENDALAKIVVTWLYPVKWNTEEKQDSESAEGKVKCVIWDLDNTLWDGVLVEDGPAGVRLRAEVLTAIEELDRRGVVQSIASKNDHDAAWERIAHFGLDKYFLYPAIHWGPKSSSIQAIAAELNLHVNSFLFVDDSPIERAEVVASLPQVRVMDAAEVGGMLERSDLQLPVTAEASTRREKYQQESVRRRVLKELGGDYDDFLRKCNLNLAIFVPADQDAIDRCVELFQRTNQLNSSGRRHSKSDLEEFLIDRSKLVCAVSCWDNFGKYGLVGVVVLDLAGKFPVVVDFVLSCRVAAKAVEPAIFGWLGRRLQSEGHSQLGLVFVPTSRNGVVGTLLEQIGFAPHSGSRANLLVRSLETPVPRDDIVLVTASVLGRESNS